MTGRHVVSIETLMLRAGSDNRWSYRRVVASPDPGQSPDEAARLACGIAADEPSTVVHSTSWRHRPGEIVLTYAVCPDPEPWRAATELTDLEPARGAAPATPAPERIEVAHVAAHAIRHLAFLMAEDPVVRAALRRHPEVAGALEATGANGRDGDRATAWAAPPSGRSAR
ncbi:hypothetical protein [Nonomuraea sp. LPB2021202275-12-8]|uniref:hypothetical protein n=1 Tax=Nonomuraea sp. LPB2021202275-12-8 TaxID=3120159 RepID=UPI00300D9356